MTLGLAGEVIFAALSVSRNPPVRWELATGPGEDASSLEPGHFFGYPVDSGTGCFMDERTASQLAHSRESSEALLQALLAERWGVLFELEQTSDLNVAAFQSGPGDGIYPSYWGLDAGGDPSLLVTDFGYLLGEDAEDEADDVELGARDPAPTPHGTTSARFLALLVDTGGLQLADGCDRSKLEREFSRCLAKVEQLPSTKGAQLLVDWIIERDDVEELYATDDELAIILDKW